MQLERGFDAVPHIERGYLKRITGNVDGRRLDVLYEIDPRMKLVCGNGCPRQAKYLLYMRTHKGNESYDANCEQHSRWFLGWFRDHASDGDTVFR